MVHSSTWNQSMGNHCQKDGESGVVQTDPGSQINKANNARALMKLTCQILHLQAKSVNFNIRPSTITFSAVIIILNDLNWPEVAPCILLLWLSRVEWIQEAWDNQSVLSEKLASSHIKPKKSGILLNRLRTRNKEILSPSWRGEHSCNNQITADLLLMGINDRY